MPVNALFNVFPAVNKSLILKAKSIVETGDVGDKIFEITMFEPDADTLTKIHQLNSGLFSNLLFDEISIEFLDATGKEKDLLYRQRFQYLDTTTFGVYQTFKLRFFISKL